MVKFVLAFTVSFWACGALTTFKNCDDGAKLIAGHPASTIQFKGPLNNPQAREAWAAWFVGTSLPIRVSSEVFGLIFDAQGIAIAGTREGSKAKMITVYDRSNGTSTMDVSDLTEIAFSYDVPLVRVVKGKLRADWITFDRFISSFLNQKYVALSNSIPMPDASPLEPRMLQYNNGNESFRALLLGADDGVKIYHPMQRRIGHIIFFSEKDRETFELLMGRTIYERHFE